MKKVIYNLFLLLNMTFLSIFDDNALVRVINPTSKEVIDVALIAFIEEIHHIDGVRCAICVREGHCHISVCDILWQGKIGFVITHPTRTGYFAKSVVADAIIGHYLTSLLIHLL